MDCDNIENSASDHSLSDDDDNGEENVEDTEPTECLFCKNVMQSIDLAIKHLKDDHSFDLIQLKNKFKMDQYSYIKMINFIRTHEPNPNDFFSIEKVFWDDEKYLKPVKYEPWLTFDFEDFETVADDNTNGDMQIDENIESDEVKFLKEKLLEKDELLRHAFETIRQLQIGYRRLFEKDIDKPESKDRSVADVSIYADEGYFSTYAHFSIHYDMLSDSVRTSSYRDAILENKEIIHSKTVLDVGCGTSILSMFASSAGAEKIIAIDNSEIIYKAMDIARVNNFTNIDFIKGRLEDTALPVDKFDIIISEWMGYFLIFEGMLDSIIYARDHHLKPDGILIPNHCNISLIGYGNEERHQEYVDFWDSVYGFNMSSIKSDVLKEPIIEICKPEWILTESQIIADYDLNTVNLNYSNFDFDFNLNVIKDGKLTSFVGYFDTFFNLPIKKVQFSTSPNDKPTHWKQVVFFIEKPIKVNKGDVINGRIQCRRNIKDMRSLNISIKVFDKEYKYRME